MNPAADWMVGLVAFAFSYPITEMLVGEPGIAMLLSMGCGALAFRWYVLRSLAHRRVHESTASETGGAEDTDGHHS